MPDLLYHQLQTALGAGYTLERELGGGGMSRVFVARDAALERDVVVKVLSPDLAAGLSAERFTREIKLAAGLQQANIVPLFAAGQTDGLPYYTMPFVDGLSLRARLDRHGALPVGEAISVFRDVARALAYAHDHGVVHRDIKPENILLSGAAAVVTDFGIAKALAASKTNAPGGTLTQVGTSIGTPAYMAPEQAAGDPATDHRADLYALGCVAYEMLTGAAPFAGRAPHQLLAAHLTETPASLAAARPDVSPALTTLVMQCLAKNPAERPQSARAVLDALDGAASGTIPGASRATPTGRRRRPALLAAAAVVLLLVVGVAAWAVRARPGAADVPPSDVHALAVLPFEHQGDSTDAYVAEGITDEIRGKLAGVRDLVVIARASSTPYRGTTKTPREIARELGVRYLLTGTVRVSGSGAERRVIVRPELVEVTAAGQPQSRWGEPFDVRGTDALQLQGAIAQQVVGAMEVAVGGADRARLVAVPTRDPAAYDAYLRARAEVRWGDDASPPAQRRALPLLEEAVRRDSTMVDAWVALATARAALYSNGRERTPALAEAARTAAERVLALEPGGVRGLLARAGYRRVVAGDLTGARADYDAAARAAPGEYRVQSNFGFLLAQSLGRPAEALPHLERATALNPRGAGPWRIRAQALLMLGRVDDARRAADHALALAPGVQNILSTRLDTELASGDSAAVRAVLARLAGEARDGATLLELAQNAGWLLDAPTAARALAVGPEGADGDRGAWAGALAVVHFYRGDTARARAYGDTADRALAAAAARPNADARDLADRATAEALAGRRAAAVATASRALARSRAEPNELQRADAVYGAAAAAALAGARDSALAWVAELRARPGRYMLGWMRLDPRFATLRGDARFEALLAAPMPQVPPADR